MIKLFYYCLSVLKVWLNGRFSFLVDQVKSVGSYDACVALFEIRFDLRHREATSGARLFESGLNGEI